MANKVNPDQTLRSVASDLGLQCLQRPTCLNTKGYYGKHFSFSLFDCFIRTTCLYNVDPLKPDFYIVKLGFTGVFFIFSYFCLKT